MRAAYIDEIGGPEVIRVGDLPEPALAPGQVAVRVAFAALNPIDLYIRSGLVAMAKSFPYVIGCDFAGTIEKLGPGVTGLQVGDRVWGSNQGLMGRQGTAAELAAVDSDYLYPTPANVPDQDAAALALVGITAHLGLFRSGRLAAGETVYVSGGSGGVGSMVIQMAKIAGARVITTVGSPAKQAFCLQIGADAVLNYKADDVPAGLREFAPDGIDVWFETQREPDLETAVPLLRKRGRMLLIAGRTAQPVLPLGAFYPRDCSVLGYAMFNASPDEQRVCAQDINDWAAAGQLKAQIGKVFPLAEAAEAERLLEANTLGGAGTLQGKVVIQVA